MAPKSVETDEVQRILVAGRPDETKCDNKITTSRYTLLSFLPVATKEQFRRVANIYFLVIGIIMAVGYYTTAFDSAISPWTTLGPLAIVISISLAQEGSSDYARHKSDDATNRHPCVVLKNAKELDTNDDRSRDPTVRRGKDVSVNLRKAYFLSSKNQTNTPMATSGTQGDTIKVAYESVQRRNIRAGDIVLMRNRDVVPADVILLASSNDRGGSYIETSSIDGETNLKLRNSPHLPKEVVEIINKEKGFEVFDDSEDEHEFESLEQATKRIARMSALAFPNAASALDNPANPETTEHAEDEAAGRRASSLMGRIGTSTKAAFMDIGTGIGAGVGAVKDRLHHGEAPAGHLDEQVAGETKFVAALSSEPPNASVNTYSGKLTLPPVELGGPGIEIPLNADNILLRGAVLRNTEWAIGLACFTGTDTKLVQNSFETPSKFSQLDQLMNKTVVIIIFVMILCIVYLASMSVYDTDQNFDQLWYLGLNKDTTEKWPYLPDDFEPPEWDTSAQNWIQKFFLFVTLLTNFVPLSLYVTVEIVVVALKLFINVDMEMYHADTDTRALARSSTVTDLGQVQYVFSDKTGTLTQNVMRFKRCSVDGLAFGAPVEKARPGANEEDREGNASSFHPLRHLLMGQVAFSSDRATSHWDARRRSGGLAQLGEEDKNVDSETLDTNRKLSFNAEMFLRVMSLCHTVVVEKDLDAVEILQPSASSVGAESSSGRSGLSSWTKSLFGVRKNTAASGGDLDAISEMEEGKSDADGKQMANTAASQASPVDGSGMGPDGAPMGFAYQAESPDEGALVEAASTTFGFQVVGRDASGIRLACSSPSILQDSKVVEGLKKGKMTAQELASQSALNQTVSAIERTPLQTAEPRMETWTVLAVNKFDSDRKRMSILIRSPPDLGSIPMLLCKGADSSMLDPNICVGVESLMTGDENNDEILSKSMELDVPSRLDGSAASQLTTDSTQARKSGTDASSENFESTALLGIQAHLGDFATEGLRTLVLGVRILTEEECTEWLDKYTAAAASIKNREEKLKAAAFEIEKKIHIVGATAIEDKLQRGVPETIAKLEKAGINLWVLTGDKRETAVEIGYATHVLTPKMHVTEVADGPTDHVRALMAMEFFRLVKMGKLTGYQRTAVDGDSAGKDFANLVFKMGKSRRAISRSIRRFYHSFVKPYLCFLCATGYDDGKDPALQTIAAEEANEINILQAQERKKNVRDRAEKIIRDFHTAAGRKHTPGSRENDDELSLTSDDRPHVFTRAQSAKTMMDRRRSQGSMKSTELRSLELAELTAQQAAEGPVIEEDLLSLRSFIPGDSGGEGNFDRRKRTLLERVFAVDHAVRHGTLVKHLNKDKLASIGEDDELALAHEGDSLDDREKTMSLEVPRGLVIEGAALHHLLGDSELEELLFAVASCSVSVIACRVSPKQKALLVGLVRKNVSPEPVTLAIGDGANDVGMIQEAHVGVGISGLEGQQAVNSSDFAIAQFRYLEELLLIHGRWNFFRQSTVVLFSFYKNAVMAGCLIVFQAETLYSGTPLFDEWLIAMLNFVAFVPIAFLGFFDRCLEKDYVKQHPEVYAPGRNNELMTFRILIRWIILVFVHIFTLFYFTVWPLKAGGGATTAWTGQMRNKEDDPPGDGQGGDLKSVGTVTYTCLIIMLGYKVLFESRSILHGRWPAFTCRKSVGEGFLNRLAYTWVGLLWLSYGFYFFAIYIYSLIGRATTSQLSQFVDVTFHVLHTRSIHWMLIVFVPIMAMVFDVTGKVYANMFFPTQTQIHVEREAKMLAKKADEGEEKVGSESGSQGRFGNGSQSFSA